jgi:general secretion pathway protein H
MPTSITDRGACRGACRPARQGGRSRGFTLIEILVVMVLVAVTLSIAVANVAPDNRALLRDEAQRLATSFRQAQDEALLTGVTLGWQPDTGGYRFLRRPRGSEWQPLDQAGEASVRRLPTPVQVVDVEVGGVKVEPGALVVLSPSSVPPPVRIVLQADGLRAAVEIAGTAKVVLLNAS